MPKIYKILTIPHPILRKKSVKIDTVKTSLPQLEKLCRDMIATMIKADGVGLAAPQIGKSICLIAVNTADGPFCLINPEIKKKSLAKAWGEEGCLSVPEVYGEVKRHKKISCQYRNLANEIIQLDAEGLLARVIQHEVDHLDGVLFIDKMRPIKNKESGIKNKE